jgi:hypothetical protein
MFRPTIKTDTQLNAISQVLCRLCLVVSAAQSLRIVVCVGSAFAERDDVVDLVCDADYALGQALGA